MKEIHEEGEAADERNVLDRHYKNFLDDVHSQNGGEECDDNLKVFCGYMRLRGDNEMKKHMKAAHPYLFSRCACSFNTMKPDCELKAACAVEWEILEAQIDANTHLKEQEREQNRRTKTRKRKNNARGH